MICLHCTFWLVNVSLLHGFLNKIWLARSSACCMWHCQRHSSSTNISAMSPYMMTCCIRLTEMYLQCRMDLSEAKLHNFYLRKLIIHSWHIVQGVLSLCGDCVLHAHTCYHKEIRAYTQARFVHFCASSLKMQAYIQLLVIITQTAVDRWSNITAKSFCILRAKRWRTAYMVTCHTWFRNVLCNIIHGLWGCL